MRGVKRCQGSTGRMKKHRYSNEFKVTAVKMANAPEVETARGSFVVVRQPHVNPTPTGGESEHCEPGDG